MDAKAGSAKTTSLESAIGGTPLIRLTKLATDLPDGVEIYAKAEHLNPGGSVKDRPALAMILAGEESGALHRGKIILDATSGNTGIAYAMIGAARGYRVELVLPKNAGPERKRILRLYGAEVIETDALSGTDGAQIDAKELAGRFPEKYFYPDQYNNDANWKAHYDTTAVEIWRQTNGRVTHFLAGIGTSGTFMGTTRRLNELNPRLVSVAMQPATAVHGLEGMKHMETAIRPGIYDPGLADMNVQVETEDAWLTTQKLARDEGLFVGPSSGANVYAALRLARNLKSGAVVVTVVCDTGSRYLSESFWNREEYGGSAK